MRMVTSARDFDYGQCNSQVRFLSMENEPFTQRIMFFFFLVGISVLSQMTQAV